jgi:hypothetical protein
LSKFGYRGGEDDGDRGESSPESGTFPSETSRCLKCFPVVGKRTARLIYMTVGWNVYYCSRCRGWFKSFYKSRYLVEPIEDKKLIASLVKQYMMDQEILDAVRNLALWASRTRQMMKEFFHGAIAKKAQTGR